MARRSFGICSIECHQSYSAAPLASATGKGPMDGPGGICGRVPLVFTDLLHYWSHRAWSGRVLQPWTRLEQLRGTIDVHYETHGRFPNAKLSPSSINSVDEWNIVQVDSLYSSRLFSRSPVTQSKAGSSTKRKTTESELIDCVSNRGEQGTLGKWTCLLSDANPF